MANHTEISSIRIRGAREHNLRNVDLDLPRNWLIVLTGLSGSGKSSLAFDTIYAEGLSPAISIEQKSTSRNPHSTVGTVTEVYDYLRLLFARIGIAYSPATGLPIESRKVSQMVNIVMALPRGTRLNLLAPVARGRKGEFRRELAELRRKGFQRVRINGDITTIADAPKLEKNFKHDIEVVVDRVVVRDDIEVRLADSIETGLGCSDGLLLADNADTGERLTFSSRFACPISELTNESRATLTRRTSRWRPTGCAKRSPFRSLHLAKTADWADHGYGCLRCPDGRIQERIKRMG